MARAAGPAARGTWPGSRVARPGQAPIDARTLHHAVEAANIIDTNAVPVAIDTGSGGFCERLEASAMENNDTIAASRRAIRAASAERARGAGRGSCWRAAAAVVAALAIAAVSVAPAAADVPAHVGDPAVGRRMWRVRPSRGTGGPVPVRASGNPPEPRWRRRCPEAGGTAPQHWRLGRLRSSSRARATPTATGVRWRCSRAGRSRRPAPAAAPCQHRAACSRGLRAVWDGSRATTTRAAMSPWN